MRIILLVEANTNERGDAKSDRLGFYQSDIALDDRVFLQEANRSQARAGGQADGLGELLVGDPAVGLQPSKDPNIYVV